MFDEDAVDHIAKVLKMLDLINIPGVDSHRLRMKVFLLSLADDAKQWWISDGDGEITTWEELVEKFFYEFYSESHDGKDEMLDEGDNWGINPLEFISRVNSSFENHMIVDGRTKKNPHDTTTNSFFKPYLKIHEKNNIEIEDERSQIKRKSNDGNLEANILNNTSNFNDINDERPNKRVCKSEKFEEKGQRMEGDAHRVKEAEDKDLAGKKSTMLAKYLQSGILAQ
ncbi:hypothetical protein Tco_1524295 [Tanacetum coccineum]